MFKSAAWISCAVALASASPARADEDLTVKGSQSVLHEDSGTIRIPYGDLQLQQQDAVDALKLRVRKAVRAGCSTLYAGTGISQEWSCQHIAWGIASPQIDQAIANARFGMAAASRNLAIRIAHR